MSGVLKCWSSLFKFWRCLTKDFDECRDAADVAIFSPVGRDLKRETLNKHRSGRDKEAERRGNEVSSRRRFNSMNQRDNALIVGQKREPGNQCALKQVHRQYIKFEKDCTRSTSSLLYVSAAYLSIGRVSFLLKAIPEIWRNFLFSRALVSCWRCRLFITHFYILLQSP